MPKRNLHGKPFDEGTKVKLDLYREYLREWLPVFINSPYVDTLQIFDFFADRTRCDWHPRQSGDHL